MHALTPTIRQWTSLLLCICFSVKSEMSGMCLAGVSWSLCLPCLSILCDSHSDLLPNDCSAVQALMASGLSSNTLLGCVHMRGYSWKDVSCTHFWLKDMSLSIMCDIQWIACDNERPNKQTDWRASCSLFSRRSVAVWTWGWAVCVDQFAGPLAACWTPDTVSLPLHSSLSSCRW